MVKKKRSRRSTWKRRELRRINREKRECGGRSWIQKNQGRKHEDRKYGSGKRRRKRRGRKKKVKR